MADIIYIEDNELARLCARGDEKARKELYTRYAAYLYTLCIRYIGDKETARDLMHDAFIKIYDTAGRYRPTGSLKSWCTRVTINMAIDYLRKSRRLDMVPLENGQKKIPEPDKDMLPSFGDNDATSSPTVPTDKPIEVLPPADSTEVKSFGSYGVMTRSESGYTDYYDHYLPVSFGLSARIFLSDRFSVNTGINYTRYTSTRNRVYHSSNRTQKEMQSVHYLGIPIRLDLIAVSKKNFTLYVGGGCQMDKCVYAKAGEERLHENQILFGVNGTIGIQVNFSPVIGLYFEPEISYALNEGTIPIFRSTHSQSFTLRAGLRLNL